ncbi:hypothetical protein [Paenibacillus sp. Soil522]|uniref:hypothetical protein n=1 Tax=Paenibacillus sp. Soil522 TaxID=1736388 RepID=UPI0006F53320|nr:hypothetical protein [Paenibacillus sp. Soil522]KRE48117.1 hypothetical protein ASG81_07270 [Paenibacillus sp. Soil522]
MNAIESPTSVLQDRPFCPKAIQIYLVAILFNTTSHILLILLPLSSHELGARFSDCIAIGAAALLLMLFFKKRGVSK